MAALLVDLTADCLLLGLLELRLFGDMVPSGKGLTRSRMAILNPFSSLSRSLALIFDEAQTITANAALARSRGGNRSSAMAPTTLCIVAFTVEIIPDSVLSCGSTGSESEQKKSESRSQRAPGSASSFYHQPYQCRPSHCDCHVYITRHAIEWPQRYLRTLDAFVY